MAWGFWVAGALRGQGARAAQDKGFLDGAQNEGRLKFHIGGQIIISAVKAELIGVAGVGGLAV